MRRCESFEEALFVQMTMADSRAVAGTLISGEMEPQ
jgi:hypothetical protein